MAGACKECGRPVEKVEAVEMPETSDWLTLAKTGDSVSRNSHGGVDQCASVSLDVTWAGLWDSFARLRAFARKMASGELVAHEKGKACVQYAYRHSIADCRRIAEQSGMVVHEPESRCFHASADDLCDALSQRDEARAEVGRLKVERAAGYVSVSRNEARAAIEIARTQADRAYLALDESHRERNEYRDKYAEALAEVSRLQSVISDVTKRLERITEGRC